MFSECDLHDLRVLARLLQPLNSGKDVVVEDLVINRRQLLILVLIQNIVKHQHDCLQGFGLYLRLFVV